MRMMPVALAAAAGDAAVARIGGRSGGGWRAGSLATAFMTGWLVVFAWMIAILVRAAWAAKTLGGVVFLWH